MDKNGHLKVGVYVDVSNIAQNGGFGMQYDVLREFACRNSGVAMRLNAYVAHDEEMAKKLPNISQKNTETLEQLIDKIDDQLPRLKNFILPGGHLAASQAHICRTVCRRCERFCVALNENEHFNYPAIPFLNRLSDYLFSLARIINLKSNTPDVEWVP